MHHITRVEDDPKGYGDGQDDHYECSCGMSFSAVQYGGAEGAFEHLEDVIATAVRVLDAVLSDSTPPKKEA